jgi:hypothetical protein
MQVLLTCKPTDAVLGCCLHSVGMCDMDPMTRAWLSSSDAPTSLKITCLKMAMVVVATALDDFGTVQPPLVALLVFGVCFYQLAEVSDATWHVAPCMLQSGGTAV